MHLQAHRRSAGPSRLRMGLVVAAWLGLVAGCAPAVSGPVPVQPVQANVAALPGPTAHAGDRDTEASLALQIDTNIGQAPCQTDAQCRTLGLGANACGGPVAWRAWSTQASGPGEKLQSLADQLSAMQRKRQAQAGMVSTCRYLPDPGAVCQAQHCVLKPTADAGS